MKYWSEADMAAGHAPRKILRIRTAAQDAIEDCGWPGVGVFRIGRSQSDHERASLPLDPRGAYHLTGDARHEWEHSIAHLDRTRHSIKLLTLSERGRQVAARLVR